MLGQGRAVHASVCSALDVACDLGLLYCHTSHQGLHPLLTLPRDAGSSAFFMYSFMAIFALAHFHLIPWHSPCQSMYHLILFCHKTGSAYSPTFGTPLPQLPPLASDLVCRTHVLHGMALAAKAMGIGIGQRCRKGCELALTQIGSARAGSKNPGEEGGGGARAHGQRGAGGEKSRHGKGLFQVEGSGSASNEIVCSVVSTVELAGRFICNCRCNLPAMPAEFDDDQGLAVRCAAPRAAYYLHRWLMPSCRAAGAGRQRRVPAQPRRLAQQLECRRRTRSRKAGS